MKADWKLTRFFPMSTPWFRNHRHAEWERSLQRLFHDVVVAAVIGETPLWTLTFVGKCHTTDGGEGHTHTSDRPELPKVGPIRWHQTKYVYFSLENTEWLKRMFLHRVTANNRLMNSTEWSFALSDHFIDVFTHYMSQCTENMESHYLYWSALITLGTREVI